MEQLVSEGLEESPVKTEVVITKPLPIHGLKPISVEFEGGVEAGDAFAPASLEYFRELKTLYGASE